MGGFKQQIMQKPCSSVKAVGSLRKADLKLVKLKPGSNWKECERFSG